MFSTQPHEYLLHTPSDIQQLGFSTFSLTGGNYVLDMSEAVGNTETPYRPKHLHVTVTSPHCPEHLCVPIASPRCLEWGQPKAEGTHLGSTAPVVIAHQGGKGKIKPGWITLELENMRLKGDLGACLHIHSQTHRDFS